MQDNFEEPQKNLKQANSIRKITIDSIQPVIVKIEDHIAYLLAETTKLRQQNLLLQQTIGNHKKMNDNIYMLGNKISNIEISLDKKEAEFIQSQIKEKEQFESVYIKIDKIQRELKRKEGSINDLYGRNSDQSNKIDKVKEDFQLLISSCNENVQNYGCLTRRLDYEAKEFHEAMTLKFDTLKRDFNDRSQKYEETDQKISLYMQEREEMRNMISETLQKVENTISKERYEHDWRVIRLENQDLKRNVSKQINSALTPEVRKFLPQIMERMAQLRKVDILEQSLWDEKKKNLQVKLEHEKTMKELESADEKLRQMLENNKKTTLQLDQKIKIRFQEGKKYTEQNFEQMDNKIYKYVIELRETIAQKDAKLQKNIDQLIQKNRENIYRLVVDQIPQSQKEFFETMKQFLPLLESTKTEIMQRCDEITEFGKQLQDRLNNFNNRIVKIKGDVFMEMQQVRKKSKTIESHIIRVDEEFAHVGHLMSIFSELFMINFSLGFEITSSTEVFVTYNDGIIYERNKDDDAEIFYRKTKTKRDSLKRSALGCLIKTIDELLSDHKYSFLKMANHKPSDFFKFIKEGLIYAYVSKEEGKNRRSIPKSKADQVSREKNKLSVLDNQSKTIDTSNLPPVDRQREFMSQTLNSDFKMSLNRKSDKGYKGRYSQAK